MIEFIVINNESSTIVKIVISFPLFFNQESDSFTLRVQEWSRATLNGVIRLFARSSASKGKRGAELKPGSAAFPAGLTKTVSYVVIAEVAQ